MRQLLYTTSHTKCTSDPLVVQINVAVNERYVLGLKLLLMSIFYFFFLRRHVLSKIMILYRSQLLHISPRADYLNLPTSIVPGNDSCLLGNNIYMS